jgi:hypothetical protein
MLPLSCQKSSNQSISINIFKNLAALNHNSLCGKNLKIPFFKGCNSQHISRSFKLFY